ncbi:MAG: ABC transporter permease, partial [Burkholderiaceae bacterium]
MSARTRFWWRRAWQSLLTILLVAVMNFCLLAAAPGDLADVLAGESGAATPEYMTQLRESYGLDRPFAEQLARYVGHLARLDLGYSFRQSAPVLDVIQQRLPATLLLMLVSLGLALLAGIALGALAARRPHTWFDNCVSTFALLAYATPLFWLGLMMIVLFSVKLDLLPSSGISEIGLVHDGFAAMALDVARHLVLPASTLALFYMAVFTRMTRAAMIEVYGLDFVRTARAKGISEGRLLVRHVLRNAILPVVTSAGMQVGAVLGGSVVIESVFSWPGLGRLSFEAIMQRDMNLLLGVLFVSSVLVVMINLLVDLLYTRLDPRI